MCCVVVEELVGFVNPTPRILGIPSWWTLVYRDYEHTVVFGLLVLNEDGHLLFNLVKVVLDRFYGSSMSFSTFSHLGLTALIAIVRKTFRVLCFLRCEFGS